MNTIVPSVNPYLVEQAINQRSAMIPGPTGSPAGDQVDFTEQSLFPELKPSSPKTILSQKEMATLSMLFGSAKPEELTLYGHAQIQSIHKGHLIDIKG
ncbi:MAG: hypothetical protein GXO90_04380 [FCB group bacterium]|nr:hypothetical protein [FCB group bacterium]